MAVTFDCIVLGLGGVGSATLAALARRGVRVLGIDRFSPPHERGSSHGDTRTIRRAYYEHPDYIPLVESAFRNWRELEAETGRSLLTRRELFLAGPSEGEAISGTLESARLHDLDIAEIPRREVELRFPHFRIHPDDTFVHERDAGFLRVEACIQAHLDVASKQGAETRCDEPVVEWSADGRGVRVRTARNEYAADRVVVTAGAWAAQILRDLDVSLQVRRKVLTWHAVGQEHRDAFREGPIYLFDRPAGVFYGFPALDDDSIKVGEHTGGCDVPDPTHVDRELHERDIQPIAQFLNDCLYGVDPVPLRHTVCMYTMTPDGNFIVDRHPNHPNVVIAAGLSGHGFKFAPVLASALADLSLEGESALPIDFLKFSRFSG